MIKVCCFIFQIDAHEDDVNAVAFADDSSHILFSGGDDGLCKVKLSPFYLLRQYNLKKKKKY